MWQLFIIPAAFVAMSVIGFVLMGADKRRAEKGACRIPEKVLFGVSFLLGGVGSLVGMFVFRHKTKHASFRILLPLSALWSLAVTAAAEYGVWLAVWCVGEWAKRRRVQARSVKLSVDTPDQERIGTQGDGVELLASVNVQARTNLFAPEHFCPVPVVPESETVSESDRVVL